MTISSPLHHIHPRRGLWAASFALNFLFWGAITAIAQSPYGFEAYKIAGSAIVTEYGQWRIPLLSPVENSGAATITIANSSETLLGGPAIDPVHVGHPLLLVDPQGSSEIITPTGTTCGGTDEPCTLTAVFAHPHAGSVSLTSASGGLQEAIDATADSGGGIVRIVPGWTGDTSQITTASLPASVLIRDERGGTETWYASRGNVPAQTLQIGEAAGQSPLVSAATLAVQSINGVMMADQFSGADAGAKINACLKSLPAKGGVCDARGLGGSVQYVAENMFQGVTSPFYLLLGADTFDISATQDIQSPGAIVGMGPQTQLVYTPASGIMFLWEYPYTLATSVQAGLRDVQLQGPGSGSATAALQMGPLPGSSLAASQGAQGMALLRVSVQRFGTGITLGNNAWFIHLAHDYLENNGTALLVPSGITNSGEQIAISDSVLADSNTGIDIEASNVDVMCESTSLDYNFLGAKVAAGTLLINNGHFEVGMPVDFVQISGGSLSVHGSQFVSTIAGPITTFSANRANNVVTLTSTTPLSGFTSGSSIILSGMSDPSFDGTFTILSTPSSNTLTFAQNGPDGSSSGGSAVLVWPQFIDASGNADVLVSDAVINTEGSRVSQFVHFNSSGILRIVGTVPLQSATDSVGSGLASISSPSPIPLSTVDDPTSSTLSLNEKEIRLTGSVTAGGLNPGLVSLTGMGAPGQTADLLDAENSAGTNVFSVTATGAVRLASEGSGSSASRNGVVFSTSGNRTEMQWQDYGNSTGPYFAVDPSTDSLKLLLGTNGADRWFIDGQGNLGAATDNVFNIGSASGSRPAGIYAGSQISTPVLSFSNDVPLASSPRITVSAFIPGTLSSTLAAATWTPDRPIIIVRAEAQTLQPPSNCTTNAVVQISNGSTSLALPISAAHSDSLSLNQAFPAGVPIQIGISTPAAGCSQPPANANVVVQYRMQ